MHILLWIEASRREADTPGGEVTDHWSRLGKEYFDVETLSGDEQQTQSNSDTRVTHKLTSVYRTGMTTANRLTAGDEAPAPPRRIFNVQSVINVNEDNRKLLWIATEVV